jgi:hypothetical protein
MKPNLPTQEFSKMLKASASTLSSCSTSLLSIAVRLAASGNNEDALKIIALAQELNGAEDVLRGIVQEATDGKIVRLSSH